MKYIIAYILIGIFSPILNFRTYADESPSIEATVEWINTKLKDFGGIRYNGLTDRDFRIAIDTDGDIIVSYTDSQAGPLSSRLAWKKYNANYIKVERFDQTGYFFAYEGISSATKAMKVICLKGGDPTHRGVIVPIPAGLEDRFLAAFRSLLNKVKAERKEPF